MVFEEIGRKITNALGKIAAKTVDYGVEKAQTSLVHEPERRKQIFNEINKEVFVHSIKPEMFRTKEMREELPKIKDKLLHSPETLVDWIDGFMAPFLGKAAPQVALEAIGINVELFDEPSKKLLEFMNLMADFGVLIGYIDTVSTALSFTLIRKVGEFADRVITLSGLHLAAGFGLGTAMGAALGEPFKYSVFKQTTPLVPGANDLIRFQLREVWVPEFRREQLMPPPSQTYYDFMSMQGYSKEHADSWWAAHWRIPPPSEAFEMFWRLRPEKYKGKVEDVLKAIEEDKLETVVGKDKIPPFTRDDLFKLLRRDDWLPRYIPQLTEIAYRPYTRVDVRRMRRAGVLKFEDVVGAMQDLGFDPERARTMAVWYEVDRLDKHREELVGLIQNAAAAKKITKEEAMTMLEDLDIDRDAAEFIIDVALARSSPETPAEWRQITQRYRKATARKAIEVPKSLIEKERRLVELKKELEEAKRTDPTSPKVVTLAREIGDLEQEIKQLKASLGL